MASESVGSAGRETDSNAEEILEMVRFPCSVTVFSDASSVSLLKFSLQVPSSEESSIS